MLEKQNITEKIKNAFRIDRSLRLVWQASPRWSVINLLLVCIKGILPLFLLYLMKLIVDELSQAIQSADPLASLDDVIILIILAGTVSLVSAAVNQIGDYAAEVQSSTVRDYVHTLIHKKSVEVDLAYYENPEYYNTLHRAQLEGPYRPHKIVNSLIQAGQNTITLAAMIGLLFMFHWSISLFLFLASLPGVIVRLYHSKKQYLWQKKRTSDQRRADYFNWILSTDSCAKEIRLFDIGDFFTKSFQDIRTILRREQLSLSRKRGYAEFGSKFLAVVILTGCFFMIGYRTLTGSITLGDMVMYFQAFQRGLTNLQSLLSNVASLYEDNLFVSYFFKFLKIEKGVIDPLKPVQITSEKTSEIEIRDVSFSYPGARGKVLNNINMTIKKGEVVALVGPNGSGKSTLVKLLCRLYDPEEGQLLINGIDYRSLSQTALREQISTVFQDFVKYHLTVKENIWLGDTGQDIDSDAIHQAAAKANATHLVAKLPGNYDTILGRRFSTGEELSLGEWQKIGVARAFFRGSQLLILDEPASSLDPHSEYQMFSQFQQLIAGRSALLISHRLSAVRMADKICVLSDGTITEMGTHRELLQLDGEYAEMFKKQTALYQKRKKIGENNE